MKVNFFDQPYLLYYNDYRSAKDTFKNDFYVMQRTVGWPKFSSESIVIIYTRIQTERLNES